MKQFGPAPDLNLFELAKELTASGSNIVETNPGNSINYSVGHSEIFWLVDNSNTKTYQSEFTLVMVTPHAYWYVEDSLHVSMIGLERSAARFEETIYPTITQIFGSELNPKVRHPQRLNILNARLDDVAGYFSSTDEYPIHIRPRSNQRKIIYVNAEYVSPGSANYDLVLSHELQHAIHWNADASEDTWVNEGLSELASSMALQSIFSIKQFLRGPPISLVNWPTSTEDGLSNYGAASLFMHFFTEHYGGRDGLQYLLSEPKDNIEGINQYLLRLGYEEDFDDVFKQWAAANVLDTHLQDGDEILGYDNLDVEVRVSRTLNSIKNARSDIPQYAVEYTELSSISEPVQLSFQGNTDVSLLPVRVGKPGCWWSNSGDSINSTMLYHIGTLTDSTATLEYQVWFEIEKNWDYLYIEVSIDQGETWQIMETSAMSKENPLGNAFGPGYSGRSDGWLTDSVDLTPFVGVDLWMRFQYITDDAVNAAGACFRNVSVSGITINDEEWLRQGFVFTNNVVRQNFQIQLITIGEKPQVLQLPIDLNNFGKWTIQPPKDDERLILSIGSLAEKTREFANYTLSPTPIK